MRDKGCLRQTEADPHSRAVRACPLCPQCPFLYERRCRDTPAVVHPDYLWLAAPDATEDRGQPIERRRVQRLNGRLVQEAQRAVELDDLRLPPAIVAARETNRRRRVTHAKLADHDRR